MGGSTGLGITTESQVRAMERTAKKVDIDSREGHQFTNGVQRALANTNDEKLKKRLQKILDDLN